jgi:succinoglycan biosynthesis protein ExoA
VVMGLSLAVATTGPHWGLLLRLPCVIAAQQLAYGVGSLFGWWDAWRHGQGRERFAKLTR